MVSQRLDLGNRFRVQLTDGAARAVICRCPTHPDHRQFQATPIAAEDGAIWVRCYWCDTAGRVRGIDKDFDRGSPQPHCFCVEAIDD